MVGDEWPSDMEADALGEPSPSSPPPDEVGEAVKHIVGSWSSEPPDDCCALMRCRSACPNSVDRLARETAAASEGFGSVASLSESILRCGWLFLSSWDMPRVFLIYSGSLLWPAFLYLLFSKSLAPRPFHKCPV